MNSFFRKEIEISEWIIPFLLCGCGLKLFFYEVFDSVPAYQLASFFSETVWAVIFTAAGVLQALASWLNLLKFRKVTTFISAVIWLAWAICIAFATTKGFGFIMYSGIAVMCIWTFHRVKQQKL